MHRKSIYSSLVLAVALMGAGGAQAFDGEIQFIGEVTAQTCTINGGTGQSFTVTLPTVSAAVLAKAQSTAGRTAFAIELTDCQPDTGHVKVYFEPGPTVNPETNQLLTDPGVNAARNIEIALLNESHVQIGIGAAGENGSQFVSINNGSATLNFFAKYVSTGNATAGSVNSRVNYTLVYE